MVLLLALLMLVFVPSPWNLVAALASALLGAVEVLYWERRMRSHKMRTGVARRARPAVLLAALVLALAGCGGSDESTSEKYANGVCSSLSTWVDNIQTTLQELQAQGLAITGDDVRNAFDDVLDANQTLREDIGGLGPPETDDGNKAKSELDDLMTVLSQEVDKVQEALNSGGGAAAVASVVTSAVATASNAVNETYQQLRGLDPGGELSDAFKNSDDCKSLEDQLSQSGGG